MMCAEPGMMPMKKPSSGAARDRHRGFAPFLAGRQQVAQLRRNDVLDGIGARRRQDLAEAEQADRDRHDADAVAQFGEVEAVAEMAGHVVDADHAEQQAEAGHQQRADQRRRRHIGEEDQAEHQQRGVFRRPKANGDGRQRRRHHRQHQHAEGAADPRPDRRDAKRGAGAPLLAPWRSRRCRSSPRRLRPGCASKSTWSSRHIASRNRCRRA